jgi:hypothetical protein
MQLCSFAVKTKPYEIGEIFTGTGCLRPKASIPFSCFYKLLIKKFNLLSK